MPALLESSKDIADFPCTMRPSQHSSEGTVCVSLPSESKLGPFDETYQLIESEVGLTMAYERDATQRTSQRSPLLPLLLYPRSIVSRYSVDGPPFRTIRKVHQTHWFENVHPAV